MPRMDKTLADCWDFLKRHGHGAGFADAELVLLPDDASLNYWWGVSSSDKLTVHMTAPALVATAEMLSASRSTDALLGPF